jgi:ABC-type branched-subunit amino acid transport system substrate-binding protein
VLGGTTLATALLGGSYGQTPDHEPLRIGFVLPTRTGRLPVIIGAAEVAGEAARKGAVMGEEEHGFNAELLGHRLDVLIGSAPDADAAYRAAQRLVSVEEVSALCGGFGVDEALALNQVAAEHQIPFFNIGSLSDALRGDACNPFTFHIEASAAMYLDALAGWFVRAGFRRWFPVYATTPQGDALHSRLSHALQQRHWGAEEVGKAVVEPNSADYGEALEAIRRSKPEVVVLLLGWLDQLDFLGQYEAAGLDAAVTGLPEPVAQTRDFYTASRDIAPNAGTGFRAALWEATLDAYGARELNTRFLARWGVPMDPPAWAAYQAIKILLEAVVFGGGREGPQLVSYLGSDQVVFDVYKGIGVSFRPWDHQLRQSLYLVKIDADAPKGLALATLVGELPAIYMPGTDPLERLDQLGDLQDASACRF